MERCARCLGNLYELSVFCGKCGFNNEPDFNQLINRTIDNRYTVYARWGKGERTTYFNAVDSGSGIGSNIIVIKIIDPTQLVSRDTSYTIRVSETRRIWKTTLERMRLEAETLISMNHPNIARYYSTGLVGDDLRYVAMEYLLGRTLRAEMEAREYINTSDIIKIIADTASALSETHKLGIIHRELTPDVIYLEPSLNDPTNSERIIKVTDFGITNIISPPDLPPFAKRSPTTDIVNYVSPEHCCNIEPDHRSDIYSLGIIFYEAVTGELPFKGRTATEVAMKHIKDRPVSPKQLNPEIPEDMEKVILRMIAKDPNHRYQTMDDAIMHLLSLLFGEPIEFPEIPAHLEEPEIVSVESISDDYNISDIPPHPQEVAITEPDHLQPVKQSAETYVSISEIMKDVSNVPPLEAEVKESTEILLDSPESPVADIIPLSNLQHLDNMENQEPTSQQNADDSTQSKRRAKSGKNKPVTTGSLRDLSKELSSISSERHEEYDKPLTTGELQDLSQDLSSIKKEQSKREEREVIDAVPITDELPPQEKIPETAIAHYKPSPQSGHALRYTAITAASAIIVISSVLLIRYTLYSNNQTNGEGQQQADRSTPPPIEASPTPTLAVALPSPTPEIATPTPAPATPTPTPVIVATPTPAAISKIVTPEKPKPQAKSKRVDKKSDPPVSKPPQAETKPRPARSGVPTPAPTIFERFKPKN